MHFYCGVRHHLKMSVKRCVNVCVSTSVYNGVWSQPAPKRRIMRQRIPEAVSYRVAPGKRTHRLETSMAFSLLNDSLSGIYCGWQARLCQQEGLVRQQMRPRGRHRKRRPPAPRRFCHEAHDHKKLRVSKWTRHIFARMHTIVIDCTEEGGVFSPKRVWLYE